MKGLNQKHEHTVINVTGLNTAIDKKDGPTFGWSNQVLQKYFVVFYFLCNSIFHPIPLEFFKHENVETAEKYDSRMKLK